MISTEILGLLGFILLFVILLMGVPIALGAALIGFLGLWFISGSDAALNILGVVPFSRANSYMFIVIPLFVFMGFLAFYCGIPTRAFEAARKWLGHIPGGLAMAVIFGNAAFGACSGSSVAACATMGRLTIPEMLKLNYSPRIATGVVAATGSFAAMIPPSGMAVVYAIMANTSVGQQLLAGLFPGLITAFLFAIQIYIMVKLKPTLGGGKATSYSWPERFRALPPTWGVLLIALVIIGGIYSGVFTPIEAAGISAFIAFILLLITRGINKWASFLDSLRETGTTTAMVFLLIVGFTIFAHFISLSRLPSAIVGWITILNLNRYIVLTLIVVLYLMLGCFMDALGMMLVTMPMVVPLMQSLGFDLVWFGVMLIKLCEIGAITPPIGVNIYVVKGIAPPGISMGDIFLGALPFLICELVSVVLLAAVPQIALFLPSTMG